MIDRKIAGHSSHKATVSGYFCVDNGTLTFDSYKPLHMAEASAPLCGKIICADIGIRDEWHPEF